LAGLEIWLILRGGSRLWESPLFLLNGLRMARDGDGDHEPTRASKSWLPIRRIHPPVACATFLENPTFAESPSAISSAHIDSVRLFVDAINGPPDISDANIVHLSNLSSGRGILRCR
jgi:hypothetical protein